MRYYLLAEATEKKATGVLGPQCMAFPKDHNLDWYESPSSMTKLNNKVFPTDETEFLFELDEHAILTDFISQAIIPARGFLISNKAKQVLSQFNLLEHKFYPATIISKKNQISYFWLHLIDSKYGLINFTRSIFYEGFAPGWKQKDFHIKDTEDFLMLYEQDIRPVIWAEKLYFLDSFTDKKPDMFVFSLLHNNAFVSYSVITAFQKAGITGYQAKEQEIII